MRSIFSKAGLTGSLSTIADRNIINGQNIQSHRKGLLAYMVYCKQLVTYLIHLFNSYTCL